MTANPRSENAYEVLGVTRDAGPAELRRAFHKLALKHHPDAVPPEEKAAASALFARINQAHELLRDPDRRAHYDRLLARDISPDLASVSGAGADFDPLSVILGQIRSLGLPEEQDELLAPMEGKLYREILLPSLISGTDFTETVIDALPVVGLAKPRNVELPGGNLEEGWLIVTELRCLLLVRYEHETGSMRYTYWRVYSFVHESLKRLHVYELGRVFRSYWVELEDEDDRFLQVCLGRPRLSRLLLVANAYRLPLSVEPQEGTQEKAGRGLRRALLLPALWCAPFALVTLFCYAFNLYNRWGKNVGGVEFGPYDSYPAIYGFLTVSGLTTLVCYLSPLLFVRRFVAVHQAEEAAHADALFGSLPVDYARGLPDARQPPPREDTEARQRGAPSQPEEPHAPLSGPAELDVPEAVREALGDVPARPPPDPAVTFETAAEWFQEGVRLFEAGDLPAALRHFDAAVRLDPNHSDAWMYRGGVTGLLGEWQECLSYFDEAIRAAPDNGRAWFEKGLALQKLNRHEEAILCYEKVIALAPEWAFPWMDRGVALKALGRPNEALASYDRALELDPAYTLALANKGVDLSALGRIDEGLACLDRALELEPENAMLHRSKGWVLAEGGRWGRALASYEEALRLGDPWAAEQVARCRQELGAG